MAAVFLDETRCRELLAKILGLGGTDIQYFGRSFKKLSQLFPCLSPIA